MVGDWRQGRVESVKKSDMTRMDGTIWVLESGSWKGTKLETRELVLDSVAIEDTRIE